jgi:hypothetical protein
MRRVQSVSSEHQELLGRLSPQDIVRTLASSELSLSVRGVRPKKAFLRVSDIGDKVLVGPTEGLLVVDPQRLLVGGMVDGPLQGLYVVWRATIDGKLFEFYDSSCLMKDPLNGLRLENVPFKEYLSLSKTKPAPVQRSVQHVRSPSDRYTFTYDPIVAPVSSKPVSYARISDRWRSFLHYTRDVGALEVEYRNARH